MKQYLYVSLAFLFLIFSPVYGHAATFGSGEAYSVFKGVTIPDDLYAAGGTISIVGNAMQDAFLIGGNVFIGNTISEDAFLIGGTVDVIGDIVKDLRIVSGRTTIQGTVGEDVAIASGDVTILPNSVISGDILIASGQTVIEGEVKGGVRGVTGQLVLNGVIDGDIDITADSVTVGPKAILKGAFLYASSNQAEISPDAQVLGEVTFTQVATRSRIERALPTLWGTWIFIKFFVLLISALVIQGIFRAISSTFVRTALNDPWKSILRGFLVTIAVPCIIVLVLLTFVGIPFMVLGVSLYVAFLVLAYLFSPIVLGGYIFKVIQKTEHAPIHWKSIAVGVCVVMILGALGIVGSLLQSALFLLTLGSIYHVLLERFVRARD